jgi:hypothetical protein
MLDFDQPSDSRPQLTFREEGDHRLENDFRKARELSASGKHLEAGILLMELADVESTADENKKTLTQPDLLELEALSELTVAGQSEGYRNVLKLKYPEWDGRNSPIFDVLVRQEGKRRRISPSMP